MAKDGGRFGRHLRDLRTRRGIGLRKLATMIGVSPAYISRIERGELPPPAEEQVVALAKVLDQDEDVLLGMAGRIASDLPAIVKKHPREYAALLRALRNMREADLLMFFNALEGGQIAVEFKQWGGSSEEAAHQIAEYRAMLDRIDFKPLAHSRKIMEAKIGKRRIDLLVDGTPSQRSESVKASARARKRQG